MRNPLSTRRNDVWSLGPGRFFNDPFFDSFFNGLTRDNETELMGFNPQGDLKEFEDRYELLVDLPGACSCRNDDQ